MVYTVNKIQWYKQPSLSKLKVIYYQNFVKKCIRQIKSSSQFLSQVCLLLYSLHPVHHSNGILPPASHYSGVTPCMNNTDITETTGTVISCDGWALSPPGALTPQVPHRISWCSRWPLTAPGVPGGP